MQQRLADATSNFIGRRHSLTLRQTPRWAHSFILILVLFGGSGILASLIIKIDEVVTVKGQLRPIEGTRDVLAPISASLSDVLIQDGEIVNEGQAVAKYDTAAAAIRAKSLSEQISLTKRTLKERLGLYKTDEISLLRTESYSADIARRYKRLATQGAQSDLAYISQRKQLEDVKTQLVRLRQQRAQQILEAQQRIKSLESELAQADLLLKNSVIRSPASGIVFELSKSKGQVTTMGEKLFRVVPQGKAKAEVFVSNQDIGFVKVGQKANVRVDAYPYTKFGELRGQVVKVGADVLEPTDNNPVYRFPVEISLRSDSLGSQGVNLPLKPGMSVQANLKLRDKAVISLLTDMFTSNFDGLKSLRN